ncbi:MAG: DUF1800 domain-containing protein [Bacteroidota bacterium]|nr:DUF1800 domain-containing protein [Bacteroidota bacterium]
MRYRFIVGVLLLTLYSSNSSAQKIILGGDNANKVKIYSSHTYNPENRKDSCAAFSSINGEGMVYDAFNTSRFLYQATLGASLSDIELVSKLGFEAWIDQQMKLPVYPILNETRDVFKETVDWHFAQGGDSADVASMPNWIHFQYAWWTQHMLNNDRLRQRISLALSEIFVISIESDLSQHGNGQASFYDIFKRHAFGNFRDILWEVSLHPMMGYYLSHLNNPKTDTIENTRPDENYAREIMQLFSIGLNELNLDGTLKMDSLGQAIPSYNQKDIKEMAKIFTGLGISEVMPNMYTDTAVFGMGIYVADMTKLMKMYETYHEPGEKYLLEGSIVPARQKGNEDISDAIDMLFNHPNVGPFIGKQLIQRLIKSNPSPAYVGRISRIFNNDDTGKRGNLAAVIKAILMDPEARECDAMMDETNGQLREPIVRYTHFTKAIDIEQYYGRYWNIGYDFWAGTGQIPLAAPTVFNFFSPFYTPKGGLDKKGLVGPEFQIHNSRTSIGYFNLVNAWAIYNYAMNNWEDEDPYAILNIRNLEDLAQDPEVLINRLDILLTHGNLGDRTRGIIKETIGKFIHGDYREDRVRMAIYLIMISPDYAILK